MPTAMPAAMRMDCTGLLRRKRAAMLRLSMGQPSAVSPAPGAAARGVVHGPRRASRSTISSAPHPSAPSAKAGPPTHTSTCGQRPLELVDRVPHREAVVVRGRTHHDGVHAQTRGSVGDLLDRRVRPEEVRRPPGHVEAVGHHAQAELVGFLRRAGEQHGASCRGRRGLRPQHLWIQDLDDGPHGGAGEVFLPDGHRTALPSRPRGRKDAREHVTVQLGDADAAGGDRVDGDAHRGGLVSLGERRRHFVENAGRTGLGRLRTAALRSCCRPPAPSAAFLPDRIRS